MLENPWLFTILYLGGITVFFALLAGLFLYWLRRRNWRFDEELEFRAAHEPEPEVHLGNLEQKIDRLMVSNAEVSDRLKLIESQIAALVAQCGKVSTKATMEEQVYQAFDRGKPVTDLARQFGRHKGEIELMLNLRRMRRKGGDG